MIYTVNAIHSVPISSRDSTLDSPVLAHHDVAHDPVAWVSTEDGPDYEISAADGRERGVVLYLGKPGTHSLEELGRYGALREGLIAAGWQVL